MAAGGPSSDEVIRRIVLELETVVKGSREAETYFSKARAHLEAMSRAAEKNTATLTKLSRGFQQQIKLVSGATKAYKGLSQAAGAAVGALTVGKTLLKNIADLGNTFNKFAVATGGGQKAVSNLIGVYARMNTSAKTAVLGIKEMADAVGKYAASGFLQFASSANKNVIQGIATITAAMKKLGQPEVIEKAMQQLGQTGGNAMVVSLTAAMGKLKPGDNAGMLKLVQANLLGMGQAGLEAEAALKQLMLAEQGLAGPLQNLSVQWNTVTANLMTAFDNLAFKIKAAVGPQAVAVMNTLALAVEEFTNSLGDGSGVAGFFSSAVSVILEVLNRTIKTVMAAVNWWRGLSEGTKTLVKWVLAAGVALNILNKTMALSSLVGVIKGIWSMSSAIVTMLIPSLTAATISATAMWAAATLGLSLVAWLIAGAWGKTDKNAGDAGESADIFADIQAKIAQQQADFEKSQKESAAATGDNSEAMSELQRGLMTAVAKAESYGKVMQNSLGYAKELRETIFMTGGSKGMFQEQEKMLVLMDQHFRAVADSAGEAKTSAVVLMNSINQQLRTETDPQKRVDLANQLTVAQEKLGQAQAQYNAGLRGNLETVMALGAADERNLEIAEARLEQVSAYKSALESVAGVPGLTIEATRQQVEVLGEAITATRSQLANIQKGFADKIKSAQKALADASPAERAQKETELQFLQNEAIKTESKLRAKILNQTTQQLQAQKELRAGYLDAIGAMALGAGKFEKFLITQKKNKRVGMELGMVNRQAAGGLLGDISGPGAAITRWGEKYGTQKNVSTGADMNAQDFQVAWDRQAKGQAEEIRATGQAAVDIQKTILQVGQDARASMDRFVGAAGKQAARITPGAAQQVDVPGGHMLKRFQNGGYTGSGPANQPAGIVHKDEYVISARDLHNFPQLQKYMLDDEETKRLTALEIRERRGTLQRFQLDPFGARHGGSGDEVYELSRLREKKKAVNERAALWTNRGQYGYTKSPHKPAPITKKAMGALKSVAAIPGWLRNQDKLYREDFGLPTREESVAAAGLGPGKSPPLTIAQRAAARGAPGVYSGVAANQPQTSANPVSNTGGAATSSNAPAPTASNSPALAALLRAAGDNLYKAAAVCDQSSGVQPAPGRRTAM